MKNQGTLRYLGLIVAIGTAGLTSAAERLAVQGPPQRSDERTIDELFDGVAERLPSFGGMFYDADGTLTVHAAGEGDKSAAEEAITEIFGKDVIPRGGLRVQIGRFTFDELRSWYPEASDLLSDDGVVSTDIDEASNRIAIGVSTEEAVEKVREKLAARGVPPDMVEIHLAEPIKMDSLRDRYRPTMGGYEISSNGGGCTLGFNAIRNGVSGFVTNSHCTTRRGIVDGDVFSQDFGTFDRVGVETVDPPNLPFSGGCPLGRRCRKSDAAFVRYDAGIPTELGMIRQPDAYGSFNDSLNRQFYIRSEKLFTPILWGEYLYKVGKRTGLTGGIVIGTCVNANVQDSDLTMLCQTRTTMGSDEGDSGSPVFRRRSGWEVELYGLHWGSSGAISIFSPLLNIQGELGWLRTCRTAFGC